MCKNCSGNTGYMYLLVHCAKAHKPCICHKTVPVVCYNPHNNGGKYTTCLTAGSESDQNPNTEGADIDDMDTNDTGEQEQMEQDDDYTGVVDFNHCFGDIYDEGVLQIVPLCTLEGGMEDEGIF